MTDFFNTFLTMNLKVKNIEFGFSRNVLSGGNPDIKWSNLNAAQVIFTNRNIQYWDQIFDYFIKYHNKKSGLVAFIEYGHPNRSYGSRNPEEHNFHASSAIIGFRK